MIKKITFLIFGLSIVMSGYARFDKTNANGYWLQKDEATNTNVGVIHAYTNDHGSLNARMFVPLANVDGGKVHPPIIYCKNCGKGDAYGHKYDYSSGSDTYQGLEFVWDIKKSGSADKPHGKGPVYTEGSVLNPHDGKYYHVKAQTIEDGDKVYVRAFWGYLGKDEYWQRIPKSQANKIKWECGLTKENIYPYQDKSGNIVDQKLWKECSTRDFVKDPL